MHTVRMENISRGEGGVGNRGKGDCKKEGSGERY